MRPVDEFGFPVPAGFEEEADAKQAPASGKRPWRVLLLGVLLAAFIGGMIQVSSDLAGDEGNPLIRALNRELNHLMGNSPEAIVRRYEAKRLQGDHKGALAEADRMVKVWPEVGHLFRGMALGELGRNRESIEAYTKALELGCPLEATAYNNRAYSRALERIELKQALADVQRALDLAGNEPAFLDTRGFVYYLLGECEMALQDFDSILENPLMIRRAGAGESLGEIYFHRGLVRRHLGDDEEAESDFAPARRLGFESDDYPEPVRAPQENDQPAAIGN